MLARGACKPLWRGLDAIRPLPTQQRLKLNTGDSGGAGERSLKVI